MQKVKKPLTSFYAEMYSLVVMAAGSVMIGSVFLFLQASGLTPNGEFLQWSNLWVGESKGFLPNMIGPMMQD